MLPVSLKFAVAVTLLQCDWCWSNDKYCTVAINSLNNKCFICIKAKKSCLLAPGLPTGWKPQEVHAGPSQAIKTKPPLPHLQVTKHPPLVCEIPIIHLPTETEHHLKCFELSNLEAGPSKCRQILLPEPLVQYKTEDDSATTYRLLLEIQAEFSMFLEDAQRRLDELVRDHKLKGSRPMGKGKEWAWD